MLTNYHTHHDRCKHAKGTVEDYVKEAVKHHYTELGMSCHVPYENFPEMGRRMEYEDIAVYLNDIEAAQRKYPQINLLKAFECEYFPHVHDYIASLAKKTDYLVLAQHYIKLDGKYQDAFHFTKPCQLEMYAEKVTEAMATGMFKFLAHPDVFMCLYPKWDEACIKTTRKIAEAANRYGIILELNANGFRRGEKKYQDGVRYPYPSEKFWSLIAAEYPQTPVVVNSDCHNPAYLNDQYMVMARDMAKALNLNVVERL